jgi:SNF related kinase
LLDF